MASKKKRNRPRPPSVPRSAPKPSAPKPAATTPAAPRAATPKPAAAAPRPAGAKAPGAKGPTRAERLAAAEKARRRKALRTRALVLGTLLAVVTLITVTVTSSRRSNDRTVSRLEASGSCSYDTKTDSDRGPGRNHVTGNLSYETNPPAGGDHDPAAAAPGVYTLESKPPVGKTVHALEHGYVAIWHRPDLAAGTLDELKVLAGRFDRDVLLVPQESLSQPVAATAWHRRLLCSQPDLAALERFVTEYRNKGPEKIPH